MHSIQVFPHPNDLIDHVTAHIVSIARGAIKERGNFFFMLSGGSTPRLLYERLTDFEYISDLDWAKVQVFWGDERCVPPGHKDSNYRMARESLLDKVPIPPENVHRIQGELPPRVAATHYEGELRRSFHVDNNQESGENLPKVYVPVFDLILLGMGTDGHTASLFPGSSALFEEGRWFVAVEHETPPPPLVPRVTATPEIINAGSNIFFLIAGANKAARLAQVIEGPSRPDDLPAQMIKPENGQLSWYVDQAAARELSR